MNTKFKIGDKVTYNDNEHTIKSIRKDFGSQTIIVQLDNMEQVPESHVKRLHSTETPKRTRRIKKNTRLEQVKQALSTVEESDNYNPDLFVELVDEMEDEEGFTTFINKMSDKDFDKFIKKIVNKVK